MKTEPLEEDTTGPSKQAFDISTIGPLNVLVSVELGDSRFTLNYAPEANIYLLVATDNVSNKISTTTFIGENDAWRHFCALIVADSPDLSEEVSNLVEVGFEAHIP